MRQMKDSGIEWIGQIPESWDTAKLLYLLRKPISDGPHETPEVLNEGIPFISVDSLNDTEDIDFSVVKKFISEEQYVEYQRKANLEEGDILFSKAATIGKTAIVKKEKFMVWSPLAIIKVDQKKLFNKFLYYLLNCSNLINDIILNGSYNTQINVGMRELESAKIPVLSLSEQEHIANYLDQKCGQFDALIEAKEKTNALLRERRQSIIYEVVTKGLNPDVPMKDSGIEWIGQIPDNWGVIPLSKVSERMNNGYVGPTRNIFFDSGVRYLQSLHIKEGKIIFEKAPYYVSPEWAAEHALGTVHTGDVLIVQTGDIGQVACVPEEYNECNCHALIIVTPRSRFCCGEFLSYLLQSHYGRNQLLSCRTGALHPHLNSGNIGSIKLPIPPVDEQKSIVAQLNLECEEYDKAIQQNNAIIEKLKEYRQSIIYEAVTGKIEI